MEQIEANPHNSAALPCIGDFLYGERDGSELIQVYKDIEFIDELLTWNQTQWQDLVKKYLLLSKFY